jgi:hypothetical protein
MTNEANNRAERAPEPADEPLLDVSSTLDDEGWSGQFRAEAGGMLRCLSCGTVSPAEAHQADEVTRLEGASDPADMVIIVPLRCPACRTRGTLIASYGPEATAEEAEVLVALEREPSEGSDLAEPTPGVTADPEELEAPAGHDAPRGA